MSKAQASQRKTPAWKARLKMQAEFSGREIERQYRLTCLQMAAGLSESQTFQPRDLIDKADQLYQFICHGKKPATLRVVESAPTDMGTGVPGDSGC